MQIYILLAIVALFGVGGWYAIETYDGAIEGKAHAEAVANKNAEVANQWKDQADATQKDLDAANQANKESIDRINALQRQVDGFRAELRKLDAASPEAKAWDISPVPADVRRLRRADLGCATADLSMQCPPGAVSGNSRTPTK